MAKLFVIFARDTDDAIIVRRGPSAWHHLISWNTRNDTFEHGAWIKGRIFENKCDLSPDGKLFLYFVLKESPNELGLPNTWTALSRPPWLKALVLWPHGDTYGGGGRFIANREVTLRAQSGWGDVCHDDFPNTCVEVNRNAKAELLASAGIVETAHWSGQDQRGRVVYTVAGKLLEMNEDGVSSELADFSDLEPSPNPAPAWAAKLP